MIPAPFAPTGPLVYVAGPFRTEEEASAWI